MNNVEIELCDSCGVRATESFVKGSSTLTFCTHHAQEHAEKLHLQDWTENFLEDVDAQLLVGV